jgi:hypothetical protein
LFYHHIFWGWLRFVLFFSLFQNPLCIDIVFFLLYFYQDTLKFSKCPLANHGDFETGSPLWKQKTCPCFYKLDISWPNPYLTNFFCHCDVFLFEISDKVYLKFIGCINRKKIRIYVL